MGKKRAPCWISAGGSSNPGIDLLSPAKDYHRPRMLNGRVRDGNGWGHPGLLTGKNTLCINLVAIAAALCAEPKHPGRLPGGGINAAKRSAVSTGQLKRLPALHLRPIDPVVFRE